MLPQPGINPDHLAPKGHCSFLPSLLSKPPELCLVLTGSNIYKGAGINLRGASAFFPQKSVPRQLETPKWSSPGLLRTCTNSHAKGFTSFLPCTSSTSPLWPHEHHSICSQLSWAPRPAQFNGVENTLHDFFFFLLAKLPLPSCGKIRFLLWLPLCSWHLLSMRQKNNFFFSSLLPYGDNLVGFAAALPPREGFKGWQDRLYTSYPNKGSKGWQWYCKQGCTQRWGENSPRSGNRLQADLSADLGMRRKKLGMFCAPAQPTEPEQPGTHGPALWPSGEQRKSHPRGKSAFSTRPEKLCCAQETEDWFPPLSSSYLWDHLSCNMKPQTKGWKMILSPQIPACKSC